MKVEGKIMRKIKLKKKNKSCILRKPIQICNFLKNFLVIKSWYERVNLGIYVVKHPLKFKLN